MIVSLLSSNKDAGLLFLPKHLEFLDVSYCWDVSEDGLLANLPPAIKTLVVLRYLEDDSNPDPTAHAHVHKNVTYEGLDMLASSRGIKVIIKQQK